MLRLLNGFAKGTVGVRPLLADRLVEALNDGAAPRVRLLGSAGMADLAPLARPRRELFDGALLAPRRRSRSSTTTRSRPGIAALAIARRRTLRSTR